MRSTLSVYSDAVRRLHLQPAINSTRVLTLLCYVYGFPLQLASIIAKPDTQISSHSHASHSFVTADTVLFSIEYCCGHMQPWCVAATNSQPFLQTFAKWKWANLVAYVCNFAFLFFFPVVRRASDHSHSISDKRTSKMDITVPKMRRTWCAGKHCVRVWGDDEIRTREGRRRRDSCCSGKIHCAEWYD